MTKKKDKSKNGFIRFLKNKRKENRMMKKEDKKNKNVFIRFLKNKKKTQIEKQKEQEYIQNKLKFPIK